MGLPKFGQIIARLADIALADLPPGPLGEVLTGQGPNTPPIYAPGGGGGGGIGADGWIAIAEAVSYVSADGPTISLTVAGDYTGKLSLGMRFAGTQTTLKCGIITSIGAFSGGMTPFTIYQGTDFAWANAAITAPKYSPVKAPFGFPLDPAKWTVQFAESGQFKHDSPTVGNYYLATNAFNGHTAQLSVPIGVWAFQFSSTMIFDYSAAQGDVEVSIGTVSDAYGDPELTQYLTINLVADGSEVKVPVFMQKNVTLASKQTYFVNLAAFNIGTTSIAVNGAGGDGFTIIRAVCDYL